VDCGKNGHGPRVKAAMDQAGVSQVDFFVCTHYHEDHFGGIDDLVGLGVPVLQGFDRGEKDLLGPDKLSEGTYLGYEAAVGRGATALSAGATISLDPQLTVTCVSCCGKVAGEQDPRRGRRAVRKVERRRERFFAMKRRVAAARCAG
jgi:glyoxylase-like metal-dependent hydrolase (beta-lactamase superfamily II)